jgi:hypothetical protein
MIRRDTSRGSRLLRAAYFGRGISFYSRYFHKPFGFSNIAPKVIEICRELNVEFVHKNKHNWNDFSDVDVVLGLRDFGKGRYEGKPPTKLINAWLAGVPFIGGLDSSYVQVGAPGYNYIQVESPNELRAAIEKLKTYPDLYENLVRRGTEASQAYVPDKVADHWIDLIDFTLYDEFRAGTMMMR